MKRLLIVLGALAIPVHAPAISLNEKVWIHGSEDCRLNRDPLIEVFAFNSSTYVLRQNKCIHYEAPFVYVLFGEDTVFVQDTGATADVDRFPLYKVIQDLIAERKRTSTKSLTVLVTHSHSHSDHTAADPQFRGQPGVTLIEPTAEAVRAHFGFGKWPDGQVTIDLGGRTLTVIPIPGHQDESVAVYDEATKWLLTGDTIYPGRLYVMDWSAYRATSVALWSFRRVMRFRRLWARI